MPKTFRLTAHKQIDTKQTVRWWWKIFRTKVRFGSDCGRRKKFNPSHHIRTSTTKFLFLGLLFRSYFRSLSSQHCIIISTFGWKIKMNTIFFRQSTALFPAHPAHKTLVLRKVSFTAAYNYRMPKKISAQSASNRKLRPQLQPKCKKTLYLQDELCQAIYGWFAYHQESLVLVHI